MSGWPDPERPGVPMSPERDGWHWLHGTATPFVAYWSVTILGGAWSYSLASELPAADMAVANTYLGPCLTPDEVQSQLAAARREVWKEAARVAEDCGNTWSGSRDVDVCIQEAAVDSKCDEIAAALRARAEKENGDV